MEIYWISYYNSYIHAENSNGYNMTLGGESIKGYKYTKEERRKKSQSMMGNKNHFYGKHHKKDSIEKIIKNKPNISGKNNPMWGKSHSQESREKMSNSRLGMKLSKETKENMSKSKMGEKNCNSKLKEIDVHNILNLYYNKKISQIELSNIYGVSRGAISSVVSGKNWKNCYNKFMENNKQKRDYK